MIGRGHGIGRALIGHLEGWAAARGIKRMILNVSEANEGAIRLYHDLGYRDYDQGDAEAADRDVKPAPVTIRAARRAEFDALVERA